MKSTFVSIIIRYESCCLCFNISTSQSVSVSNISISLGHTLKKWERLLNDSCLDAKLSYIPLEIPVFFIQLFLFYYVKIWKKFIVCFFSMYRRLLAFFSTGCLKDLCTINSNLLQHFEFFRKYVERFLYSESDPIPSMSLSQICMHRKYNCS